MKRMIIPAFVLLLSEQTLAQDVLTMRSGVTYQVKLLEITDTDLRFKMYNNLEGPLYTISRSNFTSIRYENGVMEELALQPPENLQTTAVNGYNVSATNGTPDGFPEQPATINTSYNDATSSQSTIVRQKRTTFGNVMGALLVTGMMALDIAAEVQAAKKCANGHSHSHSCSR